MDKMSVSDLIDYIREGKYEIKLESECSCGFDWEIKDGQLFDNCDSGAGCWIGNILYINDVAAAQEIQCESREQLIELTDFDDTVYPDDWDLFDILDDLNNDIAYNLRISDDEENDDHTDRRRESLVEWLKESDYDLYIDNERGFANEYTCVLAVKDADVDGDFEAVDAEEWADKYLYNGDAATEAFNSFAFID